MHFQIILERINGLRDVQNEHSDRLTTIQEKINLLSAKFDSSCGGETFIIFSIVFMVYVWI